MFVRWMVWLHCGFCLVVVLVWLAVAGWLLLAIYLVVDFVLRVYVGNFALRYRLLIVCYLLWFGVWVDDIWVIDFGCVVYTC